MTRRVLVIEDSQDIADLIALHLKDEDCDVTVVGDGVAGLHKARAGGYDLIILDLMLPGMEGLELCRRLRAESNFTPILMVTAKSAEVDRVLGLETGADDYLTKPFSIRELLARVKAIFRRRESWSQTDEENEVITAGDIVIERAQRSVTVAGRAVDLTAREFDLLVQFAKNLGRVYTRAQLLDLVWGYGHDGYEHTVNSHINRLRGKVEADPHKPDHTLTGRGVGYKFNDRTASDEPAPASVQA